MTTIQNKKTGTRLTGVIQGMLMGEHHYDRWDFAIDGTDDVVGLNSRWWEILQDPWWKTDGFYYEKHGDVFLVQDGFIFYAKSWNHIPVDEAVGAIVKRIGDIPQ